MFILLKMEKKLSMQKWAFFHLFWTLIKHQFLEFVFSLWIVDEFEKLSSLIPNTMKEARSLFIIKSMSS